MEVNQILGYFFIGMALILGVAIGYQLLLYLKGK